MDLRGRHLKLVTPVGLVIAISALSATSASGTLLGAYTDSSAATAAHASFSPTDTAPGRLPAPGVLVAVAVATAALHVGAFALGVVDGYRATAVPTAGLELSSYSSQDFSQFDPAY
jgi:hypothetical protein